MKLSKLAYINSHLLYRGEYVLDLPNSTAAELKAIRTLWAELKIRLDSTDRKSVKLTFKPVKQEGN